MALVARDHEVFVPATEPIDIRGPMPDEPEQEMAPILDVAASAARIANPIVSTFSKEDLGDDTVDPLYDYNEGVIGTEYEEYLNRFAYRTFNKPQQEALKRQIDREREDRRRIESAGLLGTGLEMAFGLASPDIALPGGAILKSVKAGRAIGRSALSVGAAAGVGVGVSEYVLQRTQETRTAEETAVAIGSSVLFGSLLGGVAGGVLSKAERKVAEQSFDAGLRIDPDQNYVEFLSGVGKPSSGGAAAVPEYNLEDFDIAGKAPKAIGKALRKFVPTIRDSFRASKTYRETMANLNEVSVGLEMNIRGEGIQAAETHAQYWENGAWGNAATKQRSIYQRARKNGFRGSYDDFDRAVGRAWSNGDIGDTPEITEAAQFWRQQLLDPLAKEGIDVGVLTQEQIDGILRVNKGYRPRVYNIQKIMAEKARFREAIMPEIEKRIRAAQEDVKSSRSPDFVSEADLDDYKEKIFQEFFDKITGQEGLEAPNFITSNLRGPLKERTLNVNDSVIDDFIESSAEALGKRHARRVGADVEIARKFGRPDMKDQVTAIRQDYDDLIKSETDKVKQANLERERLDVIGDLEARRDIIRGLYKTDLEGSNVGRVLRAANTFNFMRAMGGVLVSSLTDAVRPAMVHGLESYMRDGIGPLISNLEGFKLSANEARIMGAAAERIGAGRIATLAELNDPYAMNSPFERFLNNAATGFSKLTGLNHWNDFHKTISAVMAQNRLLRNIMQEYDALTPRELEFQGFLGVNRDIAARIRDQFAKYGEDSKGLYIANHMRWDDAEARRVYVAAINKDTDVTIVTKSAGDTPNFMHTPAGRALFQFKSFAIASNQRVLMRGLQGGMDRFIGGLVGMTTIGMAVYWLKTMESGRGLSNNPGTWVAEGLDRSGFLSIGMEINNIYEKMGGQGVYALAAGAGRQISPSADERQPASRYAVRSTFGSLFGPSFGLGSDLTTLAGVGINAANGNAELQPSDISAARRVLPYASLPYWRWLIDGGFGMKEGSGFKGVVPEMKEAVN